MCCVFNKVRVAAVVCEMKLWLWVVGDVVFGGNDIRLRTSINTVSFRTIVLRFLVALVK